MRDLLITAIVFGALPFVIRRPWIGILLWSWISYMNPHRLSWGFAFDFPFALIIAAVTVPAILFSREKKSVPWNGALIALAAFIGWMLLTTIFALYPENAWPQWDKVWKIQLFVFLTAAVITTRERLDWLIWIIVLSLGFYGVKGGIFTLTSGGGFHVNGPDGSFIAGNNEIGLALIVVAPMMWYLHTQARQKWLRLALAAGMILTVIAAIGTQSRGALLATVAMGGFLWLKSNRKLVTGGALLVILGILAATLPQSWYERMGTIQTYEEDASAMGRINAWHMAYNLASDRLLGGGYNVFFEPAVFQRYAPNPDLYLDAHSVYFEVLGEHGYVGLVLFLMLWILTWWQARRIIKTCRSDPDKRWASDLAAMAQVSLVGYLVGGAFLGLAYFDLPYHILVIVAVTAKIVSIHASPTPRPRY